MKTTVHVPIPNAAYNIYIGSQLLSDISLISQYIKGHQIAIISNASIEKSYLKPLTNQLAEAGYQVLPILIGEGEQHKNQKTVDEIYQQLLTHQLARDCTIIALGGGIVGDITGFVAASYHRGVSFIQIPTTLLAQVDSSVGGKTGINHPLGKNLIGAFYQPKAVIIDINVLKTLPKREISAGLSEIIKYGLIRDTAFLNYLSEHIPQVFTHNQSVLNHIISQSCQHKSDVVQADEKESNIRATLNLGHTFGHAIEALTHYNTYLHGEAIAIGMMMALDLSYQLQWINQSEVELAENLFKQAGCPTTLPNHLNLSAKQVRAAMQRDKKVANNQLKLILCHPVGNAVICNHIDESAILSAINRRII